MFNELYYWGLYALRYHLSDHLAANHQSLVEEILLDINLFQKRNKQNWKVYTRYFHKSRSPTTEDVQKLEMLQMNFFVQESAD